MQINPGYAWGQLVRARQTAAEHSDPAVRARAAKTVEKWERVIANMASGDVKVGSRTPTKAPAWVTLDVVKGGFATGGYAAGGELRPHERALLKRLRLAESAGRLAINLHHLESNELLEVLRSGRYRIETPEEGALLVVAWLREAGDVEQMSQLVDTLGPWLRELRFYPEPTDRVHEPSEHVRVQDLGETLTVLSKERRQPRVEAMREALTIWAPLTDRAVALALETVEGEPPRLVDGRVTGGWPCRHYATGWAKRVRGLLAEYKKLRASHAKTAKPDRKGESFCDLRELLARCAKDPAALTGRDVGRIRRIIASHVTAHGMPETEAAEARRAAETRSIAAPLHVDLRRVLLHRLADVPRDGGLADLDAFASPVGESEAARFEVPHGCALPSYMLDKLARSHDAPLATLVERGVVPSAEVLARVLPQITAQVRAQTIEDPVLQRLYGAIYAAFRRRRSLLLVNYANQVRIHELPWVAAIDTHRRADDGATAHARQTVARTSALAVSGFPYTITPNKLVTELHALGAAAELKLPLVEELAADIFMGSFTAKFLEAAKVAGRLLAGMLYARYYAIDYTEIARIAAPSGKISSELAKVCERRAETGSTRGFGVARNGKIIEQCQVLTTHNLAVLFDALPLRDQLAAKLRPLAERCFDWVIRQLRITSGSGHDRLIRFKNTAYAWRQMIFYLSFVDDVPGFIAWARTRLARTDAEFEARFEPAIRGLELAVSGVASDAAAFGTSGGRVFTGWSTERHWLSPAA